MLGMPADHGITASIDALSRRSSLFNPNTAADIVAAMASASGATLQAAFQGTAYDPALNTVRIRAGAQMRLAQVELYCDHPSDALHAIRRAVHQLEQPGDKLATAELATLERAAWLVRRHETGAAVAALDTAITRMLA